ncbi:putative Zinc finger, RING/FYVE/PHD-type [Helianthus annuus]|nr:putative Zinc finger, RING/FYVE/PHD-type [Helianthus annuus]
MRYVLVFFSKREKYADRQINRIYFPLEASSSMPPTFECPICMGPLVEQMATRCADMFCEGCIRDVQVFLNVFFGLLL